MNDLYRAMIGAIGGLLASMSKILAMDVAKLSEFLEQGASAQIDEMKVTLYIFTPILIVVGSIVAWATTERSRMKLLAIGVSAPAMIAPWTTYDVTTETVAAAPTPPAASSGLENVPLARGIAMLNPITPAHAGSKGQASGENTYKRGLQVLLGVRGVESSRYWVIVGMHEDRGTAQKQSAAINADDPGLEAWVGKQRPGESGYPVIVGGQDGYLPIEQAQRLAERAEESAFVPLSSRLSDYAGYR